MARATFTVRDRIREIRHSPVRRATIGSLLTAFTGQAVLVISGVIVARMLGPENRGYLAMLVLVPLILAQVGALGLPLAVTYYIARDRSAAAGIWAACRGVVILQAGLLTGLHCIILWLLLRDEPSYVVDAAVITIALVPGHLAQEYGLAILQGRARFLAFNVLRILNAALYAAAAAVLLVRDIDGLADVARIWTAANLGIGLLTLAIALKGVERGVDAPVPPVREMLAFGAKGLLGASSPIEYYRVDQAVVGLFLTPVALGIYAVALAFTNLPRFISTSVGMVAYPHVAEQTDRVEARRRLWRFFFATIAACIGIAVVLELTAGWLVPFFFGDEFEAAVPVVRIVLVSAVLIAGRRILADCARGLGLPGLGTVAEVVSLLALAPALAVFLPLWGVEGVAFSLVVAGAVSFPVMLIGLAREARGRRPLRLPRLPRLPRPSWAGLRRAVLVTAAVLAADALAVGLTLLSPWAAATVAIVLALGVGLVAARRGLPPLEPESGPAPAEPEAPDGFGTARFLYYAGLAFLGSLVLRPAAGVTVSDLFFVVAFALTCGTLIAARAAAPVFLGPVLTLGVLLFAVGGLLSSFAAESPGESLSVVARVVYLTVVWFWLGSVLLTRRRHLRIAIGCWAFSAAAGGAAAIAQTLWGDVIPGADVHYGRVSGLAFEVNDLGGLCAVAVVPALALLMLAKTLAGRVAATAALLLIVAGLLLSGSITAAGALVVAGVVWIAITRPRLGVVIPLVAAVLIFSAFAAGNNRYWESPVKRLTESSARSGQSSATLFTRIDAYDAAWAEIQDSPLIGVGLSPKPPDTSTGLGVHNMFLATWFQAGLIAALGLVLIVGAAVAMGWRAVAAARDQSERTLACALFAALLAFVFFGQAQEVLFQRYGWVSVALIAALRAQQRTSEPARAPAAIPAGSRFAVPAPTG